MPGAVDGSGTPKSGEAPVTITADGQNTYFGDIATADDNVILRYKETVIFADHMIYDRSSHVVTANGNVRIFTADKVYRGESVTYNLNTKAMTSSAFYGGDYPKFLSAKQVTTPEFNHYRLTNATFTTSNRENPSFHLAASTIEYRPNDEVVLKNVFFYVGKVPILYFPLIVQSLTDSRPVYQFSLGQSGTFGAFMDNKYNWVLDDKIRGTVEFDAREKRGFAGGVDVQYYPSAVSDILFKSYFAQDNLYSKTYAPNAVSRGDLTDGNVFDGVPSDSRYRIAYQQHLQFTPDFSSIADLNAWSDPWITHDFFPSEYQQENQPPNFVAVQQYNPDFTISLLASPQVNPFFETVQRLPEFQVETKQQKIFDWPVQYTSQSSVVNFERHYADVNDFQNPGNYIYNSFPSSTAYAYYHPNATYGYNTAQQNNYSAYRYDTYHEFSYPHQYFNFLSLTPRIGGRLTYYSDDNQDINDTANNNGLSNDKITNPKARLAGNVGLEGDFKISRTWLNVSNPALGIDGIRHVIEPFFDAEFAPSPTVSPNDIRGFDNRLYSTQLQPLDWTEYNSIDSIDREAVLRFGVTNSIQTKRDGLNTDLITWKTYADADFYHNFSSATPNNTLSNLFNVITYNPTRTLQFSSQSALDITGHSYNQIDNSLTWSPDASVKITGGYHYINHSPIFGDSNDVSLDLFYRLNEHWQFEGQENFEAITGRLQYQQFTVYRDLDAWQIALSYADAEINNGQSDHSIFLSFTLKALPQYTLHTPRL
jgi:LPS-assembly protein